MALLNYFAANDVCKNQIYNFYQNGSLKCKSGIRLLGR